jgi:hypothetical protein
LTSGGLIEGRICRPPRVRVTASAPPAPHLLRYRLMATGFALSRKLAPLPQPPMRFVFLGSELCLGLPSDPTSRWTPLPLANSFRHQDLQGTLTPKPLPMPGTRKTPRLKVGASLGALFKHLQLILRKTMMLYIFPYDIISDLLSHGSIEIPLFPKMSSPKLLLNFRKFLENLTSGNTLQNSNHSRNRIPWRKRNQYVNMVLTYFTAIYFKIKMARYLFKKLSYSRANLLNKNLFPLFRTPDQMILSFINCMACCSQTHAVILWGNQPFLKPYGKSPIKC